MTRLEYLMIYTSAGLPIYSKCFGSFCKAAFKNPELLSGFLSAIETIPPTLSDGLSLKAVKMSNTVMRFSKILPSGHSVVVGLSEDVPEVADSVFDAVQKIFGLDKFRDVDWTVINSDIMADFKQELLSRYLVNAMFKYGGFHDECPMGDNCLMHTTATRSRRQRIWDALREKYQMMRQKMRS